MNKLYGKFNGSIWYTFFNLYVVTVIFYPSFSWATATNSFFEKAKSLYESGDFKQAKSIIWKNIENCDRRCLLLLVNAEWKTQSGDQMNKATDILLAKDDKDFEAHTLKGEAFLILKKEKSAIGSFKKSIELNPKYEKAYLGLVKIYEPRKNYYELRVIYQDLISSLGKKPEFQNALCFIETNDKLFSQAKDICKTAIELAPDFPDNYIYLGKTYLALEEPEKGLSLLRLAANKFPKSELAQLEYALFLDQKKNYPDAYLYFKSCINYHPQSENCQTGLGKVSMDLEKYSDAYAAFSAACKINRKAAPIVRRAISSIKPEGRTEWLTRFETLAETCAL